MSDYDEPDEALVAAVRPICLALPQVVEEHAWVGTRWRVRGKTFAHVLAVHPDAPPAWIRGTGLVGDALVTILTFRSAGAELDALRHAGLPYLYAGWGRDALGLVLDAATDWEEVAELVTESYCLLAPKKLVAEVARPGGGLEVD